MPNDPEPVSSAGTLWISFDLLATGSVAQLETQGAPAWWAASRADAESVATLLNLPPNADLLAAIARTHGSAASAAGVEAICPHGIGARLVRYRVLQCAPQTGATCRVELSSDPNLAALEELLATLHKASHDLHTATATVLASAQLLADSAPASPAALRNRDRIERAIRAALAADAANLAQARRRLAALGDALTRAV